MAEIEQQAIKTEIHQYLPQVTPEFLATTAELKKMADIRERLQNTWEWWNMIHNVPIERKGSQSGRTMRIGFSHFGRLKKEADRAFGYESPDNNQDKSEDQSSQNDSLYPSIRGTAIHEALVVYELYKHGNMNKRRILNALPTYTEASASPFVYGFENGKGKFIVDVWAELQQEQRYAIVLANTRRAWFSQELPTELNKLHPPIDLKRELAMRQRGDLYSEACEVSNEFFSERDEIGEVSNIYSEITQIVNYQELSKVGHTRIQIPFRLDSLEFIALRRGKSLARIRDWKTGAKKMDEPEMFEALLMHNLVGTSFDYFFRGGICRRKEKAYITPRAKQVAPQSSNYTLEYSYFDKKEERISNIPITMKTPELRDIFLMWLGLYSDIIIAFKHQVNALLAGRITELTAHYTQPHELPGFIVDLSCISPSGRNPRKVF